MACPNFGECTARVKLELSDFSDQEKLWRFKAEGKEFKKNRSLDQFAPTVKGQNNIC